MEQPTMQRDDLERELHKDEYGRPNGPVFVKVIAHDVTMWIEIVGVERPEPQEPPWSVEAPFVLVSRPFEEKGVRATIPRLRKPTLPPVVQDTQDPAESHYGSFDRPDPVEFTSPHGRGPEHG